MTVLRARLAGIRPTRAPRGAVLFPLALLGLGTAAIAAPLNVILFIGDGMGAEHIEAGRFFANGGVASLFMETLTYSGLMTHNNATDTTTDSTAAATAMATGRKVNNGVISVALPGDGAELPTALEILKSRGKRTGLVTSDTDVTDATPAAFGAHNTSRNNRTDIAQDYFLRSKPNILFGDVESAVTPTIAANNGYQYVETAAQLLALNPATSEFVSGEFNFAQATAPTLAQMTAFALDVLDNGSDGFFLMVEHEGPDIGGHANNISQVVNGVVELDAAVQTAFNWMNTTGVADNTLILITADHETGGLTTISSNGAGNLPTVSWTTTGHTRTPVPIWAFGPAVDAGRIVGTIDNTALFNALTVPEPGATPWMAAAGWGFGRWRRRTGNGHALPTA